MGRISRLYPKGRLRLRIPKMVQSGKKYPLTLHQSSFQSKRRTELKGNPGENPELYSQL